MKFGRIVLQVNTHRLTESDFCTSPPRVGDVSLYALLFLIHSTFKLVCEDVYSYIAIINKRTSGV